MFSFEKNQLLISGDIKIILPDNIIEVLSLDNYILVCIDYHYNKQEEKFNYEGGNVFCYDSYGDLKWQWKSKGATRIWIEKDGFHIYDTTSLGYDCLVNVETGEIKKMTPVK